MEKISLKSFFIMLAFIFSLNFVWEISQTSLYEPHVQNYADFVLVHIRAALGDTVIFFTIYFFGALFFRKPGWIFEAKAPAYAFSAITGTIIAVMVEKYALATGRWAYGDLMPIIPLIKVGLVPVLQLFLLPLATLMLIGKIRQLIG